MEKQQQCYQLFRAHSEYSDGAISVSRADRFRGHISLYRGHHDRVRP